MNKKYNKEWTTEEDKILERYYPEEGPKVCKRLPGKSAYAIRKRAGDKGLVFSGKGSQWTEEELRILHEYFYYEGREVAARLPGRSKDVISAMAFRCGLTHKNKSQHKPWTE